MINIDVSVAIQVINFIFLIWVLNLILYKPIRKILLQRKEKMTGLEKGINTFMADAGEKDAAHSGSSQALGVLPNFAIFQYFVFNTIFLQTPRLFSALLKAFMGVKKFYYAVFFKPEIKPVKRSQIVKQIHAGRTEAT